MLGEFFVAREAEIDDELLEAPYVRLETVEARGLTPVSLAKLGEILELGTYDDLVDGFAATGPAHNDEVGVFRMPTGFRDALAELDHVDAAALGWAATEELRMDEWQFGDAERVLREITALARRAREERRDLWYWWSL